MVLSVRRMFFLFLFAALMKCIDMLWPSREVPPDYYTVQPQWIGLHQYQLVCSFRPPGCSKTKVKAKTNIRIKTEVVIKIETSRNGFVSTTISQSALLDHLVVGNTALKLKLKLKPLFESKLTPELKLTFKLILTPKLKRTLNSN